MTNTNDAGRWPVYTKEGTGGLTILRRNGEHWTTSIPNDAALIVSDFNLITAENRRLREAMEKAVATLTECGGDHIPEAGLRVLQNALAEPTP